MIPELGHFALILALGLALVLAATPLLGARFHAHGGVDSPGLAPSLARSLALGLLLMVALAFACLAHAFLVDDFSVALVAAHSNSLMPAALKFSAVWGNHEGSLVLWVLILSLWTAAVALFSPGLPPMMLERVLAVMGAVAVGFLLFSLLTSNPFERVLPFPPADGADLNPLLQDPGLIIHPPLLYMGYVGFAVPFAFAVAALAEGHLDAAWARWSRPWTHLAWAFLSLGIMLGSWWAYYELGWGGWWFWDPVENASFMPWLAGTALVHSLAVTEKRGLFRGWTVLLAIFAFSLSLLGTFLVRSGVITSVHSFAADPARGVFILMFLGVVVGGSLLLYIARAPALQRHIRFEWASRESLLLINNVVFLVAALTVLLGTLFPLITEALGLGRYSVGPPYFNAVFLPLMAVLIPFMGLGPIARWQRDTPARWLEQLAAPALAALLTGLLFPFAYGGQFNPWTALVAVLAAWLLCSLLRDVAAKWPRLSAGYCGMLLAHLGFAAAALGVVLTTQYGEARDVRMSPGDSQEVAGYRFEFRQLAQVRGPNYTAEEARFDVYRAASGAPVAALNAQKRRYLASGQIMTEAAIDPGLFRDLFVAMGEPLDDGNWAVRLQYKPFVRWIWGGAVLMALGGFVSVADRRYRVGAAERERSAPEPGRA